MRVRGGYLRKVKYNYDVNIRHLIVISYENFRIFLKVVLQDIKNPQREPGAS
jgi:hypothetical protein